MGGDQRSVGFDRERSGAVRDPSGPSPRGAAVVACCFPHRPSPPRAAEVCFPPPAKSTMRGGGALLGGALLSGQRHEG
ncbi:unnamed protein product [Urochloa humidicola]